MTALCLAANGIKTYVFPQLAPVPELSYAVRTLGTIAVSYTHLIVLILFIIKMHILIWQMDTAIIDLNITGIL